MLRSGKSTRFFALAAGSRVPLWRPASRVMPTTIFRSHKDVRVHENGAGVAACRRSVGVAVDVWAREEMGVRCLKSASRQWLHHTLSILPAAMEKGCVPLRSDVKFLGYASRGSVAVVQRQEPYTRSVRAQETGFLFDTSAQMLAWLDALHKAPELRRHVAEAAYDYVRQERLLEDHVGERIDFYRTYAAGVRAQGGPCPRC